MKLLPMDGSIEVQERMQREILILLTASHKSTHVVKVHGVSTYGGSLAIVMQQYRRSLLDELRAAPGKHGMHDHTSCIFACWPPFAVPSSQFKCRHVSCWSVHQLT